MVDLFFGYNAKEDVSRRFHQNVYVVGSTPSSTAWCIRGRETTGDNIDGLASWSSGNLTSDLRWRFWIVTNLIMMSTVIQRNEIRIPRCCFFFKVKNIKHAFPYQLQTSMVQLIKCLCTYNNSEALKRWKKVKISSQLVSSIYVWMDEHHDVIIHRKINDNKWNLINPLEKYWLDVEAHPDHHPKINISVWYIRVQWWSNIQDILTKTVKIKTILLTKRKVCVCSPWTSFLLF